jgi:hypothetical protein
MSDVGPVSRPPTSWWLTFFVVVLVLSLIVWAVFSYL